MEYSTLIYGKEAGALGLKHFCESGKTYMYSMHTSLRSETTAIISDPALVSVWSLLFLAFRWKEGAEQRSQ